MSKFYFTYGTEDYPFYGGWSEVIAENEDQARSLFQLVHPNKVVEGHSSGCLNCAFVYDEVTFKATNMPVKGNLEKFCYEVISIKVASDSDTGLTDEEKNKIRYSEWFKGELEQSMGRWENNLVDSIIEQQAEELEDSGTLELEGDEEYEELIERLSNCYYGYNVLDLVSEIQNGKFNAQVTDIVDNIVENRKKVYRINIEYTNAFSIYVRAKSEDEATEFINRNLSNEDLADYMEIQDGYFDTDSYICEAEEWETRYTDILDTDD